MAKLPWADGIPAVQIQTADDFSWPMIKARFVTAKIKITKNKQMTVWPLISTMGVRSKIVLWRQLHM